MQKRSLIIIGIIVLAVIVLGGFFNVTKNPKTTVQNESVKSEIITTDWKTYLTDKIFINNAASGEIGHFRSNNTIDLSWGLDYAPSDNRPNQGIGNWNVDGNTLTITGTSLSNGSYNTKDMVARNVDGKIVLTYGTFFIADNLDTLSKIENVSFFRSLDSQNQTSTLPIKVGQCSKTKVKNVENRLRDCEGHLTDLENCKLIPGSGSAIVYTNGGYQVSYEQISAVDNSRTGDEINLCLLSVPKNCPPGDDRGKFYGATNLRTGQKWELPDAEHMCGGA